MRIILLKDVEGVGKKHEIVNVSGGYARNFLLKNGVGKVATEGDIVFSSKMEEKRKTEVEKELAVSQKNAQKIDGMEIEIEMKVGEKGQLFETVTAQKIVEKIKKEGFNINKDQVLLKEPIKELGEFPVKISFKHNLESEIKVIIIEI